MVGTIKPLHFPPCQHLLKILLNSFMCNNRFSRWFSYTYTQEVTCKSKALLFSSSPTLCCAHKLHCPSTENRKNIISSGRSICAVHYFPSFLCVVHLSARQLHCIYDLHIRLKILPLKLDDKLCFHLVESRNNLIFLVENNWYCSQG